MDKTARPTWSLVQPSREGEEWYLDAEGIDIVSETSHLGKTGPALSTLPARRARTRAQGLVVSVLLLSDTLLAFGVWEVAVMLQGLWGQGPLVQEIASTTTVANTAIWLGLRALLGLYPGYGLSQTEELRKQTQAVIATLGTTAIIALAFQVGDVLSRLLLILGFLGLAVLAPLVRSAVKRVLREAGIWGKPVVILSFGEAGGRIVELLTKEWRLGFRPVAIFDSRVAPAGGMLEGVPYGGTVTDALRLSGECGANTAIFAMPHTRREHLVKYIQRARMGFRQVIVIPNLYGITNSAVVARDLAGVFGVEIGQNLLDPWTRRTKRALDLAATLTGGIFVLPIFVMLFLFVWLDSRGPVLYKTKRMGRDGKLFECIKFRTMVPEAEAALQELLEEDPRAREEYTKYHKLREDPRVTRAGRFLRRTSLDELPQLWNVVCGEMSLVGPRPYLPRESADIGASQDDILRVTPGVTGPWQVSGRNHLSFGERVQLDIHYVRNWSVWLDFLLLARTVRCVLFDRGAY